jgi:transcriptional regulator with XRE-family HTH domain
MAMASYPGIDMKATGENIRYFREKSGYSVRQLQKIFGFKDPQTIYKWQWGKCLPNIENLIILSQIFNVPIEKIIILTEHEKTK